MLNRWLSRTHADSWVDLFFVPALLVSLVVFFSVTADGFFTHQNLTNLVLQGAILAIVSFAMTYVILEGELDLSVGSGVALVSVVAAIVMRDTGSIALGALAGIGIGLLIGLINGIVITKFEVPSFIATLAMLAIVFGVSLELSNGAIIAGAPEELGHLATKSFLGVRWLIWLVAAVFVALFLVFGIKVMSVGGNREAARLSGINVDRVRQQTFVMVGFAVGIAGLVLVSRTQQGQPNAESLLALMSIAAVVVGGTSLLGGRGSVARTLWGVLIIMVLDNGLDVSAVSPDVKQVVIGVVFIAAASADFVRRRARVRRAEAEFEAPDETEAAAKAEA